jgi:hypothetical protein
MSSEMAKTISTVAIWLGMSVAITFGVSRMQVDGPIILISIVVLAIAATISTTVIWAPWTLKDQQPTARGFEVIAKESQNVNG